MKSLLPIIKRELKSAFDHPTAYVLMVVLLGALLFFGFRTVYLQNVSSIVAFWDILPWLTLFYVPAVTMRLLAEERRSGTLELLMSQPVTLGRIVVAKILAGSILVLAPLALTLIVPLTMLSAASFDWGQIVAQYLGVIFYVVAQVALGVAMSALTRNQVVSFILAFAVLLIFTITGFEVVTAEFPGWLRAILTNLSTLGHFSNITRGVLDLRDLLYFASVTAFFGVLGYAALANISLARKRRAFKRLRTGVVLVAVLAILINIVGAAITGRLDLTANQIYSLSPATQKLVRNLAEPVEIKLFTSQELPPQVALVERDVRDIITDLGRVAGGQVKITNVKVTEGQPSANEALELGVQPVQFNILEQEQFSVRQGYFGLAVILGDQHETISFINDTGNLEYQLVSYIRKLTLQEKPVIGFTVGHGELADVNVLRQELGTLYTVQDADLEAADLKTFKALVLAGPTQALNDKQQNNLYSYLESGGAVLALLNGVSVNQQFLTAAKVDEPILTTFEPLGFKVDQNLVYDLRASESVTFGGGVFSLISAYPLWPKAQIGGNHPISQRLGEPTLPWTSSITKVAQSKYDLEVTDLLTTTNYAASQTDTFSLQPNGQWPVKKEDLSKKLLAVSAVIKAVGKSSDAAAPPLGRLVLIANTSFASDNFIKNNPSNLALALNSIDWLAQDEALLGIRAKNRAPAPLLFKADWQPSLIRLGNLIGLPVIVILFGAARMLKRRGQTRKTYTASPKL